jgi:hypothetical protein
MVYSQNKEDEIIDYIFEKIGTTDKFFVEFGTGADASECNTRFLREQKGWKGVMWDLGATDTPDIGLFKERISKDNIVQLFEKYNVPIEFDFLSIDIDFNDWHIWREIGKVYKPRVVCIEYNFQYSPYDDVVVEYDEEGGPPNKYGKLTSYTQGSMLAYTRLAHYLGYKLICSDEKGINLFFSRNDCTNVEEASIYDVYDSTFYTRLKLDIIGYPNFKADVNYTSAKEILGLLDENKIEHAKHEYLRWYIPMRVYENGRLQCSIGITLPPTKLHLGSHSNF